MAAATVTTAKQTKTNGKFLHLHWIEWIYQNMDYDRCLCVWRWFNGRRDGKCSQVRSSVAVYHYYLWPWVLASLLTFKRFNSAQTDRRIKFARISNSTYLKSKDIISMVACECQCNNFGYVICNLNSTVSTKTQAILLLSLYNCALIELRAAWWASGARASNVKLN